MNQSRCWFAQAHKTLENEMRCWDAQMALTRMVSMWVAMVASVPIPFRSINWVRSGGGTPHVLGLASPKVTVDQVTQFL